MHAASHSVKGRLYVISKLAFRLVRCSEVRVCIPSSSCGTSIPINPFCHQIRSAVLLNRPVRCWQGLNCRKVHREHGFYQFWVHLRLLVHFLHSRCHHLFKSSELWARGWYAGTDLLGESRSSITHHALILSETVDWLEWSSTVSARSSAPQNSWNPSKCHVNAGIQAEPVKNQNDFV